MTATSADPLKVKHLTGIILLPSKHYCSIIIVATITCSERHFVLPGHMLRHKYHCSLSAEHLFAHWNCISVWSVLHRSLQLNHCDCQPYQLYFLRLLRNGVTF